MYLDNDLDDDNNQFLWWLGELGYYVQTTYGFNLVSVLMNNPDVAVKSAHLMKEEFMKGTDPHDFGDSIVPRNYSELLIPNLDDFTGDTDNA